MTDPVTTVKNVLVEFENGVKIAASDALHILADVEKKTPEAVAGLAVVIGTVDKALVDVQTAAGAPVQLLSIQFDKAAAADLKAVWPAVKALVATLGIKA